MVDFSKIQLLILDVDGVLTDGTITINFDGTESKRFNVLDGLGIKLWQKTGGKVILLTGRTSSALSYRARELGIDLVCQGCKNDRARVIELLLKNTGFSSDHVAYIGDDLSDISAVKYVGFGVAVRNAVSELKGIADYVTVHPGGGGAVREVIEYILKKGGRWNAAVSKYSS